MQHLLKRIIRSKGRIIFLYLLLLPGIAISQKYYFDQYSVSEGLAQSTVYDIIQDQNDNFWLGTQAGVTRFDGLEFINYTAEDGMAENGVRAICEDEFGNIWFGHDGGRITRYNGKEFQIFLESELIFKTTITSIIEDADGRIWFTSDGSGAAVIENPSADIEALKYEKFTGSRLSDRVLSSMISNDGILHFVTDLVVKKYNYDSTKFDNLVLNGLPRYFNTTSILEDSRDNFWFGTFRGDLYEYEPGRDDTKMYDLIKLGMSTNWVSALFEDKYGNIWVGTWGGGVLRIDTENNVKIFDHRNGMPGKKIWAIMEDKEGNVLFGTHENGLCAFKGDYFVSYFDEDGLIHPQTWAIEQMSDNSFWIGTNQGISILKIDEQGSHINDFEKLKGEKVHFINEDKNGSIWIAADGQGIFTYAPSGRFNYDPRINSNINLNSITAQCIDNENNLWIGTLDGLIYYEIDNRKFDKLTQGSGLAGNKISSVYADRKDRIWVGMEGKGITIIDSTEFVSPDLGMNISPTCFVEDNNGIIWIGTEGRGVLAYDPSSEKITQHLTVNNGLLANLINLLNCDKNNNIYIGTNKGLNKYLQEDDKIYGFNKKSGFVGIETNRNATCLDNEGNVWFGTVIGITKYNPSLKSRSVMEPLTHITGLLVNYESYPIEENMSLQHGQNSLIFDYRCISLNPDAVQYQIRLEGIDPDWRPPGNQTQVNYPALPPKKYTFYVKAKNSDGIWNDPPIALSFHIKPPFYLTWWFIMSCVLTVGFIIFTYIKVRERALLKENRILEDKVKDRTAEVVAQKEELTEKNKDITDSIRYAKRIQIAILPPKSPFPNTFIMFKPKDIVSGDFYWFTEAGNKQFIAAVDCTGHGVPGAFMSIIGHNSLNKIVNQYGILEPAKILEELNKEVIGTLHQEGALGDVMDGMDLALIAYDTKSNIIEYAGAYNPMYLIRDGELIETKADRQAIGKSIDNDGKIFTTKEVAVQKGDVIYLFSDGYADQFGGDKLKKFKSKNMKELMVHIASKSIEEQRNILDETIERWRGAMEQVDDILVIGRKF